MLVPPSGIRDRSSQVKFEMPVLDVSWRGKRALLSLVSNTPMSGEHGIVVPSISAGEPYYLGVVPTNFGSDQIVIFASVKVDREMPMPPGSRPSF